MDVSCTEVAEAEAEAALLWLTFRECPADDVVPTGVCTMGVGGDLLAGSWLGAPVICMWYLRIHSVNVTVLYFDQDPILINIFCAFDYTLR